MIQYVSSFFRVRQSVITATRWLVEEQQRWEELRRHTPPGHSCKKILIHTRGRCKYLNSVCTCVYRCLPSDSITPCALIFWRCKHTEQIREDAVGSSDHQVAACSVSFSNNASTISCYICRVKQIWGIWDTQEDIIIIRWCLNVSAEGHRGVYFYEGQVITVQQDINQRGLFNSTGTSFSAINLILAFNFLWNSPVPLISLWTARQINTNYSNCWWQHAPIHSE